MSEIKISRLLQHHELLREIPVADSKNGDIGSGLSNYLGHRYTSHDSRAGESLLDLVKAYQEDSHILVIHDADQDGVVSALILEEYLGSAGASAHLELKEIGCGSSFLHNATEAVKAYGDGYAVFVLDHAFRGELYALLKERFDHVVWVDHHIIQEADDVDIRLDNDSFFITPTFSTAELTWRMTSVARSAVSDPKELYVIDRIAYLTHFHDTWQYRKGSGVLHDQLTKDARELACWFDVEYRHTEILRNLFALAKDSSESVGFMVTVCRLGESVMKSREFIQKNICRESVFFMTWKYRDHEYKIAYAFHSDGRSQLAAAILDEFKDTANTAIVAFLSNRDGKVRFAVRGTDGGPPVNVICERFGGGGHRNAAGFTVAPADLGRFLQDQTFKEEDSDG